ncbi:MAG: hypothetical protein U5R31_09060 [Acidimicrobiia bacterium]|nr:hypothetical protein [Acidimicrobiia bacterium]
MRTNATAADPLDYDASVDTGGHNRFSLRAGFDDGDEGVDAEGTTLFANGRLPVYANSEGADTTFYLARVEPTAIQRGLNVTLYDMGDASQAGTLQIHPPPDSNVRGGTFSDCVFRRSDGGSLSSDPDSCKLSNVSSGSGYNGELIEIEVPLEHGYDCDEEDPSGCWVTVEADFPGGVNDTTTWSADPRRARPSAS